MEFTPAELRLIDRALSIAAVVYDADAVKYRANDFLATADVLENDVARCRALAEKIALSLKPPAPATLLEWSPLRYPCDDPENGPARRNPVAGCVRCGDKDADNYIAEGVCDSCAHPPESMHGSGCPALEAPENPCACDGPDEIEANREAGLVP